MSRKPPKAQTPLTVDQLKHLHRLLTKYAEVHLQEKESEILGSWVTLEIARYVQLDIEEHEDDLADADMKEQL